MPKLNELPIRVPTGTPNLPFDPPITLEELMCRLHRPGLADSRVKYLVSIVIEAEAPFALDPEKDFLFPENIVYHRKGSIFENTATGMKGIADIDIGFNGKNRIEAIRPFLNATYFNVHRMLHLAKTPLTLGDNKDE